MRCRERVSLTTRSRTCTRLLSCVVCVGCRTFEGLKGNFSKAISGALVSERVGVDSFGGGVENEGVASIPRWMVKSAAQQKCIPRFFWGGGGEAA